MKKEKLIDMDKFEQDILDKKNIEYFEQTYFLSKRNIRDICKRNNFILPISEKIFNPSEKETLISFLQENGKQAAAKEYGVSLAQIINWCKKNNITIEPYKGLKKTFNEEELIKIQSLYKFGYSLSNIGKIFKTTGAKIKRLLKEQNIEVSSIFDKWKTQQSNILQNIDLYIEENKNGLNLKEIAVKYDISYEVLKVSLQTKEYEVILHSYNKSKGELELKSFITSLGFTCTSIKRKHKDITFELDCFIPEKNFAIEYCGEYWHSSEIIDRKYHQKKLEWCLDQDIMLMTIFEHEWYTKSNLLQAMIRQRLGLIENRIFGRKTHCVILPQIEAKYFHDANHINGGLSTSCLDIGLIHNGEIYCVASFAKSRFDKTVEYELLRFSTKKNYIVIGGFSKLFKEFKKLLNPVSVLSYCDLRFGLGLVYEKSDFMKVGQTPPNYWYYYKKSGRTGRLESRIKYQKHRLKFFSSYDSTKTEYDIMKENGFLRIFDCGNYKYKWERN